MKVSIITVCYNSENTIESCIRSVLEQDYKNVEYIIVDGKSIDNTISIVEKYTGRVSKFISEKDDGMYFAINKGLKLASGDVIGILNSDDFFYDDTIVSKIVSEFQSKQVDAVYGDLQYVSKIDVTKVIRNWKSKSYNSKLFLRGWMPPHPTFFVRRHLYEKFGLFNTLFSISADYELMLRFLYRNKISSSYIPEILVKMRVGGVSNVNYTSRLKANREDRLAWKINGLKAAPLTFIMKPLSKLKQFLR